jgi:hypothetical protein
VDLRISQGSEANRLKVIADQATARYNRDKAAADLAQKKADRALASFENSRKLLENKVLIGKNLKDKIRAAEEKLKTSQAKLLKISSAKNLLAKKLTNAKAKAIAKQNALTAAQVKAQVAKVKVVQATAILETRKKDLANNDKVADAQADAVSALDKAKQDIAGSESKIDQIDVATDKGVFARSLPVILTIVAVVAIVSFFATVAIRRRKKGSSKLKEFDFSMEDFIKKAAPVKKKAVVKKSAVKKTATAKKSVTKKKAVVKKTAVKKKAAKRKLK